MPQSQSLPDISFKRGKHSRTWLAEMEVQLGEAHEINNWQWRMTRELEGRGWSVKDCPILCEVQTRIDGSAVARFVTYVERTGKKAA